MSKYELTKENNPILHLVVGKWRTLNHSNDRAVDDSHEVKAEILKKVRAYCKEQNIKDYRKVVGENPDIGIEDNEIILKGTRDKPRRRPFYKTGIPVDDHFVLRFIPIENNEIEIQLLTLNNNEEAEGETIAYNFHFDSLYIIPLDKKVIEALVEALLNRSFSTELSNTQEIIIVLKEE